MKSKWIWTTPENPAPINRFHYFRKVFDLDRIPENPLLRFAADTNAQLWINGHIVRRKVSRYAEEFISAEKVHAGPYLREGLNTIVVLHHNWGPITCFMRTGNRHAGLHVEAEWLGSDASWKWIEAPEFLPHECQCVGIHGGDMRIRFPVVVDAARIPDGIFDAAFDDSGWNAAYGVEAGPWPEKPLEQETPGQREYPVLPTHILAAGTADTEFNEAVESIAAGLKNASVTPNAEIKTSFENLFSGRPVSISGSAGETVYVTVDFSRPVHGFPFLELADASQGIAVDFGYGEMARPLYSGELLVKENGWIHTEGVIGKYYADRCIPRSGFQCVELPDERTARWMTLHIHFREPGELTLNRVGLIKSQYPVEPVGSFRCGDEHIDRIVTLGLTHAEVTMSDAYVDTPGREDGQWAEDIRLRALIGASWFNDTCLRRFFIRTFAGGENGQGAFHPFYPSNYPFEVGPVDWSVQWICMIYDEYMWSGDTEIISIHLEKMKRFWRWVADRTSEDGLFFCGLLLADIRNDAECSETQSSGLVSASLLERLAFSIEMAEAVQQTEWQKELGALYEKMLEAFRTHHLVPARDGVPLHVATRSPAEDRGFHQAAQTTAVFAGLLTAEESAGIIDYAFPDPDGSPPPGVRRWNNPTFAYRALRALSHVGRTKRAVRHLLERYAPYLPGHPRNPVPPVLQGALGGPLPEYWISREDADCAAGEINPHHPEDETGSHGWGAVVLQWLHETLLGVRITEPGGARIRIAPESGGLPYVSGHTMTPKGDVYVYWDPQQWRLRLTVPAHVDTELIPPAICRGRRVKTLRKDGAVRAQGETFTLSGAGTYEFIFS